MPPSGHGSQDRSSGFRSWPRWIGARAINTDFAGVGTVIGAASDVTARCEASQPRAIMVVPPARIRATTSRIRVRARMAISMEMRKEDDDHGGAGDGDAVRELSLIHLRAHET